MNHGVLLGLGLGHEMSILMEFRLHGGSCVLFGPWHEALLFVLFLYTSHSIVMFNRYNIAAAYFDSSGNRFPVERPGVSLDTAAGRIIHFDR